MEADAVSIFGRGYLGMLFSSSLKVSRVSSFRDPQNNIPGTSLALIASGPSSVEVTGVELESWRRSVSTWLEQYQNIVNHVIYISSAGTVYGELVGQSHSEDALPKPINDYGRYHVWAESALLSALDERLTVLRLSNIYGPRQRSKNGQGFITAAVKAIESNNPLRIFGNGSLIRDYVHEQDVVNLVARVLTSPTPGVFNVASGVGTKQNDAVAVIERVFERTLNVDHLPPRPTDLQANLVSIRKASTTYDWLPVFSLEVGVKTYKENF